MKNTLSNTVRFCPDIGLWAIDRPESSCVHKTEFCAATCYNLKLYDMYGDKAGKYGKGMRSKDIRSEEAWIDNDAGELAIALGRKRKGSKFRFRLMTRGEAISSFDDIARIANIAKELPNYQIWLPTRSWRNPILFAATQNELKKYPNIIIQASMDPSNIADEWEHVKNLGLGTMFYGDDDMEYTPNGDRVFKCPKTHKHLKGHCAICKGGCFNTTKPVNVHLCQH